MPIPWTAIILAILSFFGSKKAGASNAEAAMIAAGVGIGSYYLFDPSNPDNLFGVGDAAGAQATDKPAQNVSTTPGSATTGAAIGTAIGNLASQTVSTTGQVLSSWGAAGTAGVIATTAAVSGNKNWLVAAAVAGGILLLMK